MEGSIQLVPGMVLVGVTVVACLGGWWLGGKLSRWWWMAFVGGFLVGTALHKTGEAGQMTSLWIAGGFFLQMVLEHFSGGVEHAHIPGESDNEHGFQKLGFWSTVALSLHAVGESIPVWWQTEWSAWLTAILLHRVIEGIWVGLWSAYTGYKPGLGVYLFTPLIALMFGFLPGVWEFREVVEAGVTGALLYIGTTLILEGAEEPHRYSLLVWVAMGTGIVLPFLLSG